jgi:hypothetical protein
MFKILPIILLSITTAAIAQTPEDAIKYSWLTQGGTARTMAIGGAIGSLGGDVTAAFVNPAGIGFYKTGEFSFTPSFGLKNTNSNFRGNNFDSKKNNFSILSIGYVAAGKNYKTETSTSAFSFGFMQTANFNQNVYYKGLNNYSSYSEQFAEEFVNSKLSINDALNTQSAVPYTVAPALYTYLIDTVRIGGVLKVKAAPETILEKGQALQQEFTKNTKGGMYELGLSYAVNDGKKWLGGLALGIPIVHLVSSTTVSESDTSIGTTNNFKSFTYTDDYTTSGVGINLKAGLIYRPKDYIRIGLALHSPTFMGLTDERITTLTTQLRNPTNTFNVTSDEFTNGKKGEARYIQNAPWKAILSASYVFREIEDVTKQRGFISADIEYVKHSSSKFKSNAEEPTADDKAYYKQLNGVVKDLYKGNINAKIGAEVKFNTIMARLGFGYYGNPYKDAPIKANKLVYSGGLGYRNKGYFVDLTYAYLNNKDFDVPYRLQNAETIYSSLKNTKHNIVATVGVKF